MLAWIAILVPSFMVSPGLVQKVYGARDVRTVRWGVGLNSLGQAIFAFVPPVLGLCAFAAMPHLADAELALPAVMKTPPAAMAGSLDAGFDLLRRAECDRRDFVYAVDLPRCRSL